tara:strand:+ start:841 stop:1578 length:738 start_codon:yes stop_codon:yes gene_type:complete
MERRKLNNADLEKYGSYENFCKLQDEYLNKREALGHDVRSFQDRMKEKAVKDKGVSNVKDKAYLNHLNMIRKLASKFSEYSSLKSEGIYSYEDLIQEGSIAWSNAYDTYHTAGYNNGEASFTTYAHTCVANLFKDTLKKEIRKQKDYETVSLEGIDTQEETYELTNRPLTLPEWEEKSDVVRIIRSVLSVRDGDILMLKYGIGVGSPSNTYEIAELLDIPRMTVQDALKRATSNEQLKQLLIKFI